MTAGRRTLFKAGALSLAGYGVGFVLQFALPRVLLSRWGDGGYALYIAIAGYAAYIGVADAGVQYYLSQRLVILRGPDRAQYAALARGGFRALAGLAIFGMSAIGAWWVLFGRFVAKEAVDRSHVSARLAAAALGIQLLGGGVGLALSGWSTSIEQSTEQYARTQFFALIRTSSGLAVVIVSARLGAGVVRAMALGVVTTIAIDMVRFHLARALVPPAGQSVPAKDVLLAARGGLLLMVAGGTQTSLLPALAASVAPLAVGAAIPGRTVSNSARVVATSVQSVIWVPLAARITAEQEPSKAFTFWKRNSLLLSLVQMVGLPAITFIAPLLVPRWLPAKSHDILELLPVYCVEQAVFAAAMPPQLLLLAVGRFGQAGIGFLAASAFSVVVCLATIRRLGPLGFALATLSGTLFGLVPVLTALECAYWRERGQRPLRIVGPRVVLCVAAAASGPLMYRSSVLATAYLMALLVLVGLFVRHERGGTLR